jgi:tRNA(Arg) A34 adenosine deaminase TadA
VNNLPATQKNSAGASWSALGAPWRAAIEMAWQSYRDGGIAVGAVLTDASGADIGEGRNQRFAGLSRGLLAHAEMQALAALPPGKDRARDSVLYTTRSPCLMCLGAVIVARIGQVRLGAGLDGGARDVAGAGPQRRRLRQAACTVAAYRDRYGITDTTPLGAPAESDTQKIDAARARAALDRAQNLTQATHREHEHGWRTGVQRVGGRGSL